MNKFMPLRYTQGVPGDPSSRFTSKVIPAGIAFVIAPGNVESLKSMVAAPKSWANSLSLISVDGKPLYETKSPRNYQLIEPSQP